MSAFVAVPMSAVVAGMAAPVLEELDEIMEGFDRHGAGYAKGYLAHVVAGGPIVHTPAGLHSKLAAAIRDVVLEHAEMNRRLPARKR